MGVTSDFDIVVWIDNVQTLQDSYELYCLPTIDMQNLTALCPSSLSLTQSVLAQVTTKRTHD